MLLYFLIFEKTELSYYNNKLPIYNILLIKLFFYIWFFFKVYSINN